MSTDSLAEYKSALSPLPNKMLRWHLYGAGLDSLGKNGEPEVVDLPVFGPDELLVRQDACGLCFSDTKVIALGANHPRMTGRDLAAQPVTLGHEVSVTVVGVGSNLDGRFRIGDRFVVQADVFYKGKSMAYGYAISGGLAEYSVIPTQVIDGDEGCYLLPVRPDTGYVESALTEPWACVVSAYAQSHRSGIKADGSLLVVCSSADMLQGIDELLGAGDPPARAMIVGIDEGDIEEISTALAQEGVMCGESVGGWPTDADWQDFKHSFAEDVGFDDILISSAVPPEVIEAAAKVLADHGVLAIVGDTPVPRKLSLDIGRIHYNWHHYLGVASVDAYRVYSEPRTADLLAGGAAWIIGAGGPMGQMHVQRAVLHRNGPRLIVSSDVDAVRLKSVADRFGAAAVERGVKLVTINPSEISQDEFNAELRRLSDNRGYDDILSMVPVASLIEHAADYLAKGGWFNIFAGVARGTMANLDVNRIITDGVRYLGSSGSSLADMRNTLARVEERDLSTNASLAAIGGMEAARSGLQAVKEGWFPGKTLIFPLIHDLPLTPLPELKEKMPSVFALLKDGQFWTNEAEEELLKQCQG